MWDPYVQVGAAFAYAKDFHGVAQIGLGTLLRGTRVGAQLGVVNVSSDEHEGAQIGFSRLQRATSTARRSGVVNVADKVRGVQIGPLSHERSLRGLQIGLVNHAEDGSLVPWSTILNMGFGSDGGESPIAAKNLAE